MVTSEKPPEYDTQVQEVLEFRDGCLVFWAASRVSCILKNSKSARSYHVSEEVDSVVKLVPLFEFQGYSRSF